MKRVLIIIGVLGTFTSVFGQNTGTATSQSPNSGWCHTHSMWDQRAAEDPTLLYKRDAFRQSVKNYIKNHPASNKTADSVLVIPIVFHVIHNNGWENISETSVQNAIDYMNRDFRKDNADSVDILSPFKNFHPDTRIEFRRARKNPEGKCSNGITRTVSTLTSAADDQVKQLVWWDNTMYLNVWVVRQIASGAGGYSYTPPINDDIDGIVVNAGQLSALSHEAGHWLGLNHTWGPSNDANASGNCSLDDDIDDTPNTMGQSWCTTSRNSCPDQTYVDPLGNTLWVGDVIDNVQNIMDYGFCSAENFTNGQRDFMRGTLNGSFNGRSNLWSASNRIATGTNDGFVVQICPPTADFISNTQIACQNSSVGFTDKSFGQPVDSYHWEFPGGTPATSAATNPIVTYATPGTYAVTLVVTNNNYGSDTTTRTSFIEIISTNQSVPAPFGEGFESETMFNGGAEDWKLVNSSSTGWVQNNFGSYSGSKSMRIKNSSVPSGETSTLITPYLDLSGGLNCNTLTFRHAYARKTSGDNDILKVYISDDCGQTWDLIHFVSGGQMATNPNLISYTYIPSTEAEWVQTELSLNNYLTDDHILVKFEATSGLGNTLYLDHVDLGCSNSSNFLNVHENEEYSNIRVSPNPFNDVLNIDLALDASENLTIEVLNAVGQIVYVKPVQAKSGSNYLQIEGSALGDRGIYFLSIKNSDSSRNDGKTNFYQKIVLF